MNIILFNFRGLGDAIIMTEMLNKYSSELSIHNITIVTWSKNKFILSKLSIRHKLFCVSGPRKNKYSNFFLSCLNIAKLVKRKHYDLAINFSGDFKENIYLSLVNASKKISPIWSTSHKLNNIITQPLIRHKYDIFISKELENIYKIYDYIINTVFNIRIIDSIPLKSIGNIKSIGLFPFSAQDCRDWPLESWDSLGQKLIDNGYRVYYFCSEEDALLISNFKSLDKGAILYKDIIDDVFIITEIIDLSICLDSFSSHLSHFLRLPSITLFGANDPVLFATNSSTPISTDGGCIFYPCYNKPECINSASQYVCISSIPVKKVWDVLESKISLNNE